MNKASVTEGGM